MTIEEIKAAMKTGCNQYIIWERPCNVRAAYKGLPLFKRTKMLLRVGVPYDHMIEVKQGRENGDLPAVNQGLKGKKWLEFPVFKESLKTGKTLLSVQKAIVFGNPITKSETTYIVRKAGVETVKTREDGIEAWGHMMVASETSKGEMPATFDLTAENVLSINGLTAAEIAEIEAEAETA